MLSPLLHACREYIPADCLRDGEQNDSAEVLELLCSTLTTELAQHTAESLSQQAQLSWQTLSSLQHVTGSAPHRSPLDLGQQASDASSSHHQPNAADNAQLQANGADAVLHPAQQTVSEGDLLLNMSKAHDSIQSWLGQAEVHRMPLQGNVVGDMSCLKCQHSFESQHTPFLLLPLALPTAQVCTPRLASCL